MRRKPLYYKLYADMIKDKYPEKKEQCIGYLERTDWTALDVISINNILFGKGQDRTDIAIDMKHRSYDPDSIHKILNDQQKSKMTNKEIAYKYGLSRNTIAKWKRLFLSRKEKV